MRTTRKKELIEACERLSEATETRRAAEKLEKELKDLLRREIGDENVLAIGTWLVIRSLRQRADLDKDGLRQFLGEKYEAFVKTTSYETLELKKG